MSQQSSPSKRERREAARAERLERERAAAAAESRKRRLLTLGGLLALAAVVVVVAVVVSSGGGEKNASSGGAVTGATEANQLFAGIPQSGITVGDPNAKVTIAEFADPQCPFCKEYTLGEMRDVVQKYVRTGKAKMELHLMTFIGPDSLTGARALLGAAQQNKLWQSADIFYANQGEENSGYVDDAFLDKVLGGVQGLNVDQALKDASSSKVSQQLGEVKTLASRYAVESTPTVLVGPSGGTLKKDTEQPTAAGIGKMVDAALAQAK
jgi:protein-disulfide isomerase